MIEVSGLRLEVGVGRVGPGREFELFFFTFLSSAFLEDRNQSKEATIFPKLQCIVRKRCNNDSSIHMDGLTGIICLTTVCLRIFVPHLVLSPKL